MKWKNSEARVVRETVETAASLWLPQLLTQGINFLVVSLRDSKWKIGACSLYGPYFGLSLSLYLFYKGPKPKLVCIVQTLVYPVSSLEPASKLNLLWVWQWNWKSETNEPDNELSLSRDRIKRIWVINQGRWREKDKEWETRKKSKLSKILQELTSYLRNHL